MMEDRTRKLNALKAALGCLAARRGQDEQTRRSLARAAVKYLSLAEALR